MSSSNTPGPPPARQDAGGSGAGAIHPLVLILIGIAVLGIAAVGWVLAPNWYPPVTGPGDPLAQIVADEASRRATVSATRAAIATGGLGVAALLALWINNANARAALTNAWAALTNAEVAVSNARVAVETFRVAERGHLTDRYAKAIEQLGEKDNETVRIGGIYALGQYVKDSGEEGDQLTVVEVLSAFIRRELDGFGGSDEGKGGTPGADVLAAISVLAQLPPREGVARAYFLGALFHSVGISGARLAGGNLSGVQMDTVGVRCADLSNINLDGANFGDASLTRCDLTGASLRGTIFRTGQLSYSKLHDADLEGADLGTVTCEETEFNRAVLRNADLGNADLSWANLTGADLRDTHLRYAKFEGAVLDDADFAGARNLVDGQLTAKQIAVAKNLPSGLKSKEEASTPGPSDGAAR